MKVCCRICMTRENLTSISSIMDGGRISEKISFVCGLKISPTDNYPKLICHQCLSSIIIASSIKKKSIETEKVFKTTWPEETDHQGSYSEEEDPFLIESNEPMKGKYLVYEEDPKIKNQPKMDYNLSESSVKISSSYHFNYNPSLKRFVQEYLDAKPNLEIIKISDPDCIKDIERVLSINNKDIKSASKRPRTDQFPTIGGRQSTGSSRLLHSALSGRKNTSFH